MNASDLSGKTIEIFDKRTATSYRAVIKDAVSSYGQIGVRLVGGTAGEQFFRPTKHELATIATASTKPTGEQK